MSRWPKGLNKWPRDLHSQRDLDLAEELVFFGGGGEGGGYEELWVN